MLPVGDRDNINRRVQADIGELLVDYLVDFMTNKSLQSVRVDLGYIIRARNNCGWCGEVTGDAAVLEETPN